MVNLAAAGELGVELVLQAPSWWADLPGSEWVGDRGNDGSAPSDRPTTQTLVIICSG